MNRPAPPTTHWIAEVIVMRHAAARHRRARMRGALAAAKGDGCRVGCAL